MGIITLFLIAVGLSMDAFAVSVSTGLSLRRAGLLEALTVGLYFGAFQAIMPVIGYLAASRFAELIASIDHWLAFIMLSFIGARMIAGSFKKDDSADGERPGQNPPARASLNPSAMLPMALATSIDALAVGVSFAFLSVDIAPAASLIGVTTLALSAAGVKIGALFGARLKSKAEITGGAILILIGVKILLEHTGVL